MPSRRRVKLVEPIRKCFHSIIPIRFADDDDHSESDDVELLHPSPRFCRNPSIILEIVSPSDSEHVTLLELSVSTFAVAESAGLSPAKVLLMAEKNSIIYKYKTLVGFSLPYWKILLAAFKHGFGTKK